MNVDRFESNVPVFLETVNFERSLRSPSAFIFERSLRSPSAEFTACTCIVPVFPETINFERSFYHNPDTCLSQTAPRDTKRGKTHGEAEAPGYRTKGVQVPASK